MKQSDTLPTQYRHIEHLHEEVWCQKIHYWQNDSFVNLAIFSLLAFKQGLCLCLKSAYTGQSTSTTAFDEAIWYFVYTIDTLNICMKKFGAKK